MDPFHQQWQLPAEWPADMSHPWFPYSGLPFDPFGLQPPQLQQEQPTLAELQPLQTAPVDYSLPASPTSSTSNYYNPSLDLYDKPVEALLTPPSSVSSSDRPLDSPPPSETSDGCEPTLTDLPSSLTAAAAAEGAEPASDEQTKEKAQSKRGRKRKRNEADVEDEPKSCAVADAYQPTHNTFPSTTLWRVVGRLAVIGSQKTYNVTADEIHRRTSLPECLNRSHLGPLLRRGKVKGSGGDLQQLLENVGLSSNKIVNRKRYPLTTLSAFLEEEAVQFSADHREVAFKHFPFESIARLIIRGIPTPRELYAAAAEVKIARSVMDTLLSLLEEWTDGGWTTGSARILSSPLRALAMSTHSLGVEECRLHFALYARFLLVLETECDAQVARVAAAAHNDIHAIACNQFPAGLEYPVLPDGHVHRPSVSEDAQGSASFAEIPGRLSLKNKTYNVTVAEVMRRARAPESLNLSIIGSQLRKGKTKDNGKELKEELSNYGIQIDAGRRKLARVTLFTALVEGEALTVAADVHTATRDSFPFAAMAEALVARAGAVSPQEILAAKAGFGATSRIAESLAEVVLSLRLPVAERVPHKVAANAHLMLPYCSLTHGYGPDAAVSWIGLISNLFDIAVATLPKV